MEDTLENKLERCRCPMWQMGVPAGLCGEIAYGKQNQQGGEYIIANGGKIWLDGRYDGFVMGAACPRHGGPTKEQALNLCTFCTKHPAECRANPKFGTGRGNDNVYECDGFLLLKEKEDTR